MHLIYLVLLTLAVVSNSVLIILLHKFSRKNLAITALIVLLFALNIWFGPKLLTNALNPGENTFELLSRLAALGYITTPPALLIFSLAYGQYHRILGKLTFWVLLLVPALALLYLSWTTNFIGVHSFESAALENWGWETPIGPYYPVFVLWFVGLALLSLFFLFYHHRSIIHPLRRKQALFVMLSINIPLFIGTITNGVLPVLGNFVFPVGNIVVNFMSVLMVYAIFKYELFEVSPMAILSSLNHALITVDKNGNISTMNPFAEKMLRVNAPAVAGSPLQNILHVQNRRRKQHNQLSRLLTPVLNKGISKTFDTYSIFNRRRHEFPYTISVTPVYAEGQIIGANLFIRDSRKEKQKQRLKDDFFSMLTHELKTPLTAIKMHSQLLIRETPKENSKVKKIIRNLDRQIDRIKDLSQDFYELSRLQAGKPYLNKEYFGFDNFVDRITDTISNTYSRKLKVKGSTGATVFADKNKIEQVLTNLLTNAIKYSPAYKTITLELSADNHQVRVKVSDKGPGIAPKYHKKIFERFFRIETSQGNHHGLGIGLYIASEILKSHGGKIWVESKPGKGASFCFSLPINHRFTQNRAPLTNLLFPVMGTDNPDQE